MWFFFFWFVCPLQFPAIASGRNVIPKRAIALQDPEPEFKAKFVAASGITQLVRMLLNTSPAEVLQVSVATAPATPKAKSARRKCSQERYLSMLALLLQIINYLFFGVPAVSGVHVCACAEEWCHLRACNRRWTPADRFDAWESSFCQPVVVGTLQTSLSWERLCVKPAGRDAKGQQQHYRGGEDTGWNFCVTNSVRNFCAQFVRCV